MKAELFYADDVKVASTNPGWIQTAFNTLMGIFDWVGLQTNTRKTVGMVCRPYQAAGLWVDKSYTRRMTGKGRSYQDRQWERVHCLECRKDLARGSLVAHLQTQNGVARVGLGQEGDKESGDDKLMMFSMTSPEKVGPRPCPVEECIGRAATRTDMQVHCNLPHPRCPLHDMLLPWRSLNGLLRSTAQWREGAEHR